MELNTTNEFIFTLTKPIDTDELMHIFGMPDLSIDRVVFNAPATIVVWSDGTKTVVRCQEGDTYDEQTGLALCFMKKSLGNSSRKFNDILHAYIPEKDEMKVYADNEVIETIKKE